MVWKCLHSKELNFVIPCGDTNDLFFFCSGDEILEWNELSLVDCSDEEVQDIIAMDDSSDLHLVVSRDR